MAYMDDMAIEREKSKQALLAGKQPLLGDDSVKAMHALGVNLGIVPPGTPPSAMTQLLESFVGRGARGAIKVDTPKDLQVSPVALHRTPSSNVNQYSDGGSDLGATLSNLFKGAQGGSLDQMRKKLEAERQATGARVSDHIRKGRADPIQPPMGAAGGPDAAQAIPGLKPGFDASKLPPGSPAAVAYMHENAPGGAVRGYEKGSTAPGDVEIHQAYGPGDKYGNAPPKPFTSIVTHWTGGDTLESALNTAKSGDPARGGGRFGYHYYIDKDGKVYQGAPLEERTNHVKGPGAGQRSDRPDISNSNAIGISTVGSGEPNEAQKASAAKLIPQLQRQFNIKQENIVGHGQIQAGDREKNEGQAIIKAARDAPPPPPREPAWDKGLPAAADPKTNWPAATDTTPADKLTAEPPKGVGPQSSTETKGTSGSTDFSSRSRTPPSDAPTKVANAPAQSLVPAELLPGGQAASAGGGGALADQRAPYKAIADANPSVRETMAAIMIAEDGSPEGRQGVAEAMMNRVNARGEPFSKAMDPAYHADYMVKDPAKFQSRLAEIRNNPKLKAEMYALQDKAFAGSNVSNLATDYASGSTAANERATPTFTSTGGSQFFRKDINPGDHGPDNVRNIQKWKAQTEAALKNPQAAAAAPAPAADPKDVGSQSATMRDAVGGYLASKGVPGSGGAGTVSTPTGARNSPTGALNSSAPNSVFDKGTAAVPVAGAGGLQEGADVPATTGAALYPDADTAAVNAIKPPVAATPVPSPVVASAPPPAAAVAPAPPPPRAAPPPPPPSAAAAPAPAKPAAPPVNPAHAYLDMKTPIFAESMQKGASSQIPSMMRDMTVREVLNHPLYGGMARGQMAPALSKAGVTVQQLDQALKEGTPAPGKRSDAGTSGSTDFSARARTPMAPPGLDGKVPLPQPGPRTENRNAAQVELNMTPQERDLYQRHLDNLYSKGGVDNPDGSRSSLRQVTVEQDGKTYNVPSVYDGKVLPPREAGDRAAAAGLDKFPSYPTEKEAEDRYNKMHEYMDKDTGRYFDQNGRPQAPQQPQVTPEMAKALENAFKDEARVPQAPPPPPEAMPVPAPQPMPGPQGAAGGLPMAPAGLSTLPSNAYMPGTPGSQGGSIATAGLMPLPAIENSTYSTPLINSLASNNSSFGSSSLSPIPWQTLGSWGWGGSGGSSFGGGTGMDFGGGGGMYDGGGAGLGGGLGSFGFFGGG